MARVFLKVFQNLWGKVESWQRTFHNLLFQFLEKEEPCFPDVQSRALPKHVFVSWIWVPVRQSALQVARVWPALRGLQNLCPTMNETCSINIFI